MAPPLVLHSSLSNVFPTLPLTGRYPFPPNPPPLHKERKPLLPPPPNFPVPSSIPIITFLMDKPPPPNPNPTTTNKGDHILKQLNKSSLKITKPAFHPRKPQDPPPPPPPSSTTAPSAQAQQLPPVYNINKNEFRDVVQKLTGIPPSPPTASPSPPPPPPAFQPKPPGSRFHRFRPPPLSPPPLFAQPPPPFSPLPPLPAVSAAAESPISAYLRFLHSSITPNQPFAIPPFPLFSPTSGQLGFPSSPGVSVPVPSPRWKDV